MNNWLVALTLILLCWTLELCGFQLTIMHTSDVHAKIQEIEEKTYDDCSKEFSELGKCNGGQARLKTKIIQLRAKYPDSILLDSGNQYTGSLFFHFFGGKVLARLMNAMGYDAMALGNDEFDRGPKGLPDFLTSIGFDVVCTNIDVSNQAELVDDVKKSTILFVRGQEIGVVGYLTPMTQRISDTGKIVFLDIVDSIQQEVDRLIERGIDKILAFGHDIYENNMEYARLFNGVDVIVGGHDHVFLYTGKPPSTEKAKGPYPTVVTNRRGSKVLVVDGFAWGKYLGVLHMYFDEEGVVRSWGGNPVLLDKSVHKDYGTLKIINEYMPKVKKEKMDIRGKSLVRLEGDRNHCRVSECVLGNLLADAMVHYFQNKTNTKPSEKAVVAMIPSAMFRLSIPKGPISVAHVLQALPFLNTIDKVTLTGKAIVQALEHSATYYVGLGKGSLSGGFLQISGLRVVYDMERHPGARLVSVHIKCHDCRVPLFVKLNRTKVYRVLAASFLTNGGEGYSRVMKNIKAPTIRGPVDTDVLIEYIEAHSPLFPTIEGRIQFLQEIKKRQLCAESRSQVIKPSLLLPIVLVAAVFHLL